MSSARLEDALRETFRHGEFRPGQREIVQAILSGRDVVAVMPTGSGKSLCYQLPAVLSEGTTLVVSPLIALMKDQVDTLRKLGVAAAAIHSGLPVAERRALEDELPAGRFKLVYVAPERLANEPFASSLGRLQVSRLVIDEAHCISQWGHDFRPDYTRLGALRATLDVPAAAFTATATPEVRADITRQLGLRSPLETLSGFERPNLTLSVEECRGQERKIRTLEEILNDVGPPGIVYAATRKNVEAWSGLLRSLGLEAGRYHAGLGDAERRRTQERFLSGETPVIAATNAFGMGVDKADIRFVVHADIPGSIEAYYQEVGRAGRDGLPARCSLLFSPADIRTQEFFLQGSNPSAAIFEEVWRLMGEGWPDDRIDTHVGSNTAEHMAAGTARRLLRRAAQSRRVPLGKGAPPIDLEAREEKARRDRVRLDTMVRYAFNRGCRTQFIYDYFAGSAQGGAVARCGTCDVCLGLRSKATRPLSDDEYLKTRIALSGVARLSGRFGAVRIAQMLVGSRSREVEKFHLDRIKTYGKLSGWSVDQAKDFLNLLADAGLVERQTMKGGAPGAFVLALNERGRAVMKGEERPELPFPAATAPGTRKRKPHAPSPSEVDDDLLARLKSWRKGEAERRGVPAFVIFHDKTLAHLAAARPTDREGLTSIHGFGPAKLAAYGEAVLEVLRSESASPSRETGSSSGPPRARPR